MNTEELTKELNDAAKKIHNKLMLSIDMVKDYVTSEIKDSLAAIVEKARKEALERGAATEPAAPVYS